MMYAIYMADALAEVRTGGITGRGRGCCPRLMVLPAIQVDADPSSLR